MAEYIDKKAADNALTAAAAADSDKKRRTWAKAIGVLHDVPAADVVPVVRGRWVLKETVHFGLKEYKCSKCSDDEYWKKYYCRGNETYCPNCGADMRGEPT